MVQWSLLEKFDALTWNQFLDEIQGDSFTQRYEWGEFKKDQNWDPMRAVCRDKNGKIIAMTQLLVKNYTLIQFAWAPGGVLFSNSALQSQKIIKEILLGLENDLKNHFKRLFLRLFFFRPHQATWSYLLSSQFTPPSTNKLKSNFSIIVDLNQSEQDLIKKFSSKHRYYVNKGLESNVTWEASHEDSALDDFNRIYSELKEIKSSDRITIPGEELFKLKRLFGKNLFVFRGLLHGETLSSSIILVNGHQAFYYLAATGTKGREMFSAYAMMIELWRYLKSNGVSEFDFSGIDPMRDSAAGVDHFKKGFGGKIVEYLGEWEWSTNSYYHFLGNLAVKWRSRRAH